MNNQVSKILNQNVKSEMNMLYTEPMFIAPDGGQDFGLFCREHAYHTYLVCRLNAIPAKIKIGHFYIKTPDGITNCTLGSGADHAWCATDSVYPIDLSMTFHLAPTFPNLLRPLIGLEQNGKYKIRYFVKKEDFIKEIENSEDSCCIYFYEQETFSEGAEKLLEEPFCFLLPPGVPGHSWADIYGKDIFAKITLHLQKIVLNQIKPLYCRYKSGKAVKNIRSKNKAAMPKLLNILHKKRATKRWASNIHKS